MKCRYAKFYKHTTTILSILVRFIHFDDLFVYSQSLFMFIFSHVQIYIALFERRFGWNAENEIVLKNGAGEAIYLFI